MTPASPARLLRSTGIILAAGLVLVAVWFGLRSLFDDGDAYGADGAAMNATIASDEGTSVSRPPATLGSNRAPAGPANSTFSSSSTSIDFGANADGVGGVSCLRLGNVGDEDRPFVVTLDPAPTERSAVPQLTVAQLALTTIQGTREIRAVTFGPIEPGSAHTIEVPDSGDADFYVSCVVTALQRDEQILLTGQ